MSRRRKRQARFHISGVLVVDKPAGPTSHDIVDRLRRRFGPAKLGHAGTLDPFATGILVLAWNQATKLTDILGGGRKTYEARLVLGSATDSGDLTGQVTGTAPLPELDPDAVRREFAALPGEHLQAPPAFSAAKHHGKPLYEYARNGDVVEKPARPIHIYQTEVLEIGPGHIDFRVQCSRGTYVRTLGEDIARALGTVGHLAALRRCESLPFGLDQAAGPDELAELADAELAARLISPRDALAGCGLPATVLDDDTVWDLRQGRILPADLLLRGAQGPMKQAGPFMALSPAGELAAVLRWLEPGLGEAGREYETVRVFPAEEVSPAGDDTSASASTAE